MAGDAVAIIGGHGLGDNLIEMVLARNAVIAGYRATVYSNVLGQLADWFPQYTIVPNLDRTSCGAELDGCSVILCPHGPWPAINKNVAANWVAYEPMYRKHVTRVQNMANISGQVFGMPRPAVTNGIRPPAVLKHRRCSHRVCIHPTSAEISKNWLPGRFLSLARRLSDAGMETVFIMSETERPDWEPVIDGSFPLRGFSSIEECAGFLYESGYFIGNDSGGGHLASCLDIPTLSIHGRRAKSRSWRPGWGRVEVVTPRINVIGGSLRQHLWKYFLSVTAVERGFYRLLEQEKSVSKQ